MKSILESRQTVADASSESTSLLAFEVKPEMLDSPALKRLLDEVRCSELTGMPATAAYNREHNRHNR